MHSMIRAKRPESHVNFRRKPNIGLIQFFGSKRLDYSNLMDIHDFGSKRLGPIFWIGDPNFWIGQNNSLDRDFNLFQGDRFLSKSPAFFCKQRF